MRPLDAFRILGLGVSGELDAFNILSYGVIGLGFLLALLAYRLLGKEQQKEEPRRSILVAIHVFMIFSVVLCIIGFGSETLRRSPGEATVKEIARLEGQVGKQQAELKQQQAESAKQAIILQKYRDRWQRDQQVSKDIINNLKLLAALPFVPEKYKDTLDKVISSFETPPIE